MKPTFNRRFRCLDIGIHLSWSIRSVSIPSVVVFVIVVVSFAGKREFIGDDHLHKIIYTLSTTFLPLGVPFSISYVELTFSN